MFDLIHRRNSLPQLQSSLDHLFVDDDFKKRTIFLGGIPLSKSSNSFSTIQMTLTSTIEKSLRQIALSINLSWTTFISSPISNGKTMIVEYIAQQIGKRLIKIQCSDHMDSKVRSTTRQRMKKNKTLFSFRFYSEHINVQINRENFFGHLVYLLK